MVFCCFGYSFAIREGVIPDWEAIGTVLSFIAACSAIWAAVFIPWQIAQKQNRIALFEMKYEAFQQFSDLICRWDVYLKRILNASGEKEKLYACIFAIENLLWEDQNVESAIKRYLADDEIPSYILSATLDIQRNVVFLVRKLPCLFYCVEKDDLKKLTDTFEKFINQFR